MAYDDGVRKIQDPWNKSSGVCSALNVTVMMIMVYTIRHRQAICTRLYLLNNLLFANEQDKTRHGS